MKRSLSTQKREALFTKTSQKNEEQFTSKKEQKFQTKKKERKKQGRKELKHIKIKNSKKKALLKHTHTHKSDKNKINQHHFSIEH